MTKAGVTDKWEIDSAAIAPWHIGSSPNSRSLATMKKHNLTYPNNKAKQVSFEIAKAYSARNTIKSIHYNFHQIQMTDFNEFDYIFGMDHDNMYELSRIAPEDGKAKLLMLGNFDPEGVSEIRDPYCVSTI